MYRKEREVQEVDGPLCQSDAARRAFWSNFGGHVGLDVKRVRQRQANGTRLQASQNGERFTASVRDRVVDLSID